MSGNIWIRFGLQIVLVCLYSTSSHYHCANLSEGIELIKCLSDIFCRVRVRLSIFSPVSIIQYVGLYVFSLPISVMMIERIYLYIYIYICFVLLSPSNREFGSMNYYPLFRVRSWNNDVRCMSFYILLYLSVSGHAKITAQMSSHVSVEKTQQMQRNKSTDDCIAHLLTWFAPWNEVIILMLYVIYKGSQINPSWVSDSQYDCMYVPAYYK